MIFLSLVGFPTTMSRPDRAGQGNLPIAEKIDPQRAAKDRTRQPRAAGSLGRDRHSRKA
jgi:hypothetical protein